MSEGAGSPPAPDGFVKLPDFGPPGFNSLVGGMWVKAQDDAMLGGFRVEAMHCNPAGICHGGMLATFCDVHLALASQFANRLGVLLIPTISLSIDYLSPTPKGAWVEAVPEILKVTRGTVFAAETVRADGVPVVHARGIFKIPKPGGGVSPDEDTGAGLRRLLGR